MTETLCKFCLLADGHTGPHVVKRPAGRPEIGQPINIRLGDELLAAVDAKAYSLGVSRAEVIRTILADQLAGEMSTD